MMKYEEFKKFRGHEIEILALETLGYNDHDIYTALKNGAIIMTEYREYRKMMTERYDETNIDIDDYLDLCDSLLMGYHAITLEGRPAVHDVAPDINMVNVNDKVYVLEVIR